MSLFKRKPKPQPTLAEREAEADFTASLGLSAFQRAVDNLDAAAEQHDAIRAEVEAKIAELVDISNRVDDAAYNAKRKADKLREFFG